MCVFFFSVVEDTAAKSAAQADGHIFISYQWDAKSTVLRVRDRLKAAGIRVWIDEDDMCKQTSREAACFCQTNDQLWPVDDDIKM